MAFGAGGAIGEAFVVVRPDTRGFAPAAKRGIIGPMKGLAVATGGLFAAVGVASFLKDSVDEAREAVKVGKQTTAVLKSTGGAAKISAAGVSALATSLSNKTAIDDEAIQSNENLLLTFKNIKNEAGKGNDIFNQATASVLDMSVAFKQDGKSSAIQLGKALDNPIKGVTALSRVGVSFTDQQKDQIKTLVKSGDVLGAQKIILGGLREQTAGAAEAAADPWQRFGVVMGNIKESIGTALLPTINKVVSFLAEKLPGALKAAGKFLTPLIQGFKAFFQQFGDDPDITSDGFVGVMERIGLVARNVTDFLSGTVGPVLGQVFSKALPIIQAAGTKIGSLLGGLFRNFLPAVKAAGGFLGKVFGPAFQAVTQAVIPAAVAFGRALLPALKSLGNTLKNDVFPVLKAVGIVIGVVLFVAIAKVLPVILRLAGLILRLAGPILGFLLKAIGFIVGRVFAFIGFIGRLVASFLKWITGTENVGDALKVLVRIALDIFGKILDAAVAAFGWIPKIGGPLRAAQAKFREFRDSVNDSLDGIKNKKVTVTATGALKLPGRMSVRDIVGKAGGGPILGPGPKGRDSRLILAAPGEHMLTASEVDRAGGHGAIYQLRAAIRSGWRPPGFASGGAIEDARFRVVPRTSTSALEKGASAFDRLLSKIAAGLGRKIAGAIPKATGEGPVGPVGRSAQAILSFIRAADRLPYRLGAAGPSAYDCSGLVGEIWNRVTGNKSYVRRWTTNDKPWSTMGFQPIVNFGGRYYEGPNLNSAKPLKGRPRHNFMIGFRSGRPYGHTAGQFMGLGFEAANFRAGIRVGANASQIYSFPLAGYLPLADKKYDQGGWLPPGVSIAVNRTGRPERVMSPKESAGSGITQNFTLVQQPGQSAPAFVQAAMFAARTQLRPAG